jgi:very-short-patch-repair endonuclease
MLRDRDRNNTSTVQGFAVLRYMPEHIWFNPDHVLGEIRAVLASRNGQGTATRAFQPG